MELFGLLPFRWLGTFVVVVQFYLGIWFSTCLSSPIYLVASPSFDWFHVASILTIIIYVVTWFHFFLSPSLLWWWWWTCPGDGTGSETGDYPVGVSAASLATRTGQANGAGPPASEEEETLEHLTVSTSCVPPEPADQYKSANETGKWFLLNLLVAKLLLSPHKKKSFSLNRTNRIWQDKRWSGQRNVQLPQWVWRTPPSSTTPAAAAARTATTTIAFQRQTGKIVVRFGRWQRRIAIEPSDKKFRHTVASPPDDRRLITNRYGIQF